ncbi:MAG: beta-lactamase family protein [Raineya sp.]|jgi:CubicO group peptidase (beta-lactamase class C family)|nr:beta-lactamase family protein [Raineya sp.]
MKFYFLLLLIFIFWSCEQSTQKFPAKEAITITNIDDTENINWDTLQKLSSTSETALLDSMAQDFIKQWEIQGMTLGVVKDGKLVYAKGFGYAEKERNLKVRPHHLFRIASASKLVTAIGIMKLVEERKLTLDSKVFGETGILKKYNHWIEDPILHKITIRHLLTHTGGWRNYLRTDPMFVPVLVAQAMKVPSPIKFEETIHFMLSQKGHFEPGAFYDYSNFGYCLLGSVIEEITKMSYEEYIRKQVLTPIGAERMRIGKNRYKERFAHEVRYYEAEGTPRNISIYNPSDSASRIYEGNNTEALGAAGGWIASSVDMLRLVCAIDGFDTKPDILSDSSIEEMIQFNPKDTVKQKQHPLGWKQITAEKWWRTGNLSSTNISLTRRNDGYSWVLITNTGSWRASFFPYEMEGMMSRAIQKVKFPDHDLFEILDHLRKP